MTRGDEPAGAPGPGASAPRRRRRWLVEWLRRQLLRLLKPELDAVALECATTVDAVAARVADAEEQLAPLHAQVEAARAALEPLSSGVLQRHLETRIDQALAEVADLRGAYLSTRGEFEAVRDARLGALEAAVASLQGGLAGVEGEMERLRDTALPDLASVVERLHNAVVVVQAELAALRDERLLRAEGDLARLQGAVEVVQRELRQTNDERLLRAEGDLARLQQALAAVQGGVERLAAERLPGLESALAALHEGVLRVQRLGEEVRDERLPALAGRTDALLEQLHLELTTLAGLVERVIAREPLRVVAEPELEAALPAAITAAKAAFVDALRGERGEILGRVEGYVPLLAEAAPVLDLGCGRGELLEVLQRAGIEARGMDADPAMVASCQRRGLAAEVGQLPQALAALPVASVGAVTAIHLLEHLPVAGWTAVVAAAMRVLRPGGVFLVECPNPDTLRVGGGLYWADPTHRTPVHPRALELVARAVGFEVSEIRYLRPFPPEQQLASPGQPPELRHLAERLDAWLSGPRDFLLVARKPRGEA